LIVSLNGRIAHVTIGRWLQPGSKRLIRDFIFNWIPEWVKLLNDACQKLKVTIKEDAYLGSGAHGRVFSVLTADGKTCALKIVKKKSGDVLKAEKYQLDMAQDSGVCVTTKSECIMLCDGNGFALLTYPVGEQISRENLTLKTTLELFSSLFELHKKYAHGDSRIENAIRESSGKILWIDFMTLKYGFPPFKKTDIEILMRSIIGKDADINAIIDRCIKDPTYQSYVKLAQYSFNNRI